MRWRGLAMVTVAALAGCGKSTVAADAAPPHDAALAPAVATSASPEVEAERDALEAKEKTLAALRAAKRECVLPLAEFCRGTCPSYAKASADAAKDSAASVPCSVGGVETGDCGTYRFVSWSGGYGGDTMYFTADGALVGASRSSDYGAFCDGGSFSATFGVVPSCTMHATKKLCKPDPKGTKRPPCEQGDPLCVP